MKFGRILRVALLVLAVFLVVWICVVFWWQVAEVEPSGRQLLLWLGVLPVALLGGWWLTRASFRWARRPREPTAQEGSLAGAKAQNAGDEDRPRYRLEVVATALNLPIANDPDSALDAMRQSSPARLHPKLRDHAGLPVFAAWVEDIDHVSWQEQFAEYAAVTEEQARAIALLDPVCEALLTQLLALLPSPQQMEQQVVAGLRRLDESGLANTVRCRLLLSQAWPQPLRQAVGDWLLARTQECGLSTVASVHVEVVPVAGPMQVWRCLDLVGGTQTETDAWHVLLASDSLVGARSVDALQASGMLMSGTRPEGAIPGEGAAGLVLQALTMRAGEDDKRLGVCIHTLMQTAAAAEGQARAAAGVSGDLMQRAVRVAAAQPEDVAMVISDADQRPSRKIEAAGATARAFPELETAQQCVAPGAACGYLGHVAPLVVLAVACTQIWRNGGAVVALGLSATDARAAVTLMPAAMIASTTTPVAPPPVTPSPTTAAHPAA